MTEWSKVLDLSSKECCIHMGSNLIVCSKTCIIWCKIYAKFFKQNKLSSLTLRAYMTEWFKVLDSSSNGFSIRMGSNPIVRIETCLIW